MCMFNSKLTYACAVSLLIDWSIFQVNLVIMTPGQCMKHMCLNSVLYPTRSVKCSPFLMLYWLCNQAVLVVNIGTCDVVLFSCLTAVITWILVFVICWWHVWKKKKKNKKKHNMYVYSFAWEWKCTVLPWDIQCTHIQNIANLRYGNLKMQIFLDGMC